jgi:hypothetical protein
MDRSQQFKFYLGGIGSAQSKGQQAGQVKLHNFFMPNE